MKLHLGCGSKHIPGWYHIDVVDLPHIDLQHEVNSLPMLQDRSVETIYACHVLEHFMRREAKQVLAEWFRVLRPGGILRLAVPDFSALVDEYVENRQLGTVIGPLLGRQDGLYNFHHNVYDMATLSTELRAAGFTHIHRYDWRECEHAWLDDFSQAYLPHMDKQHGRLLSLNVEASRGG
jgi:predicted SAM-dependent methyltransferase